MNRMISQKFGSKRDVVEKIWAQNMLPISKRLLSPLAEAPPLDSLCAESLPSARAAKGMSPLPRDASVLRPPKRMRLSAETERLELQFLSCVLAGKPAKHAAKKQSSDMDEYCSAMSAMILDEAKGMLSEMQKGWKSIPCKTALTSTSYSMMEFNIPETVDAESWSVLLAEVRDSPIHVIVRRSASGELMGVIAQRPGETGLDARLYPSSVYLGDLWRQWQVCQTKQKEGRLLREILGNVCTSAAERVQTNTFNERGLNASQAQGLNMCLSGAQCIHCIQGPPGTGKSKTILNFVDFLARAARDAGSEDLFLVASMTNKACQQLATEFRKAAKSIPIALAGNMKKLPADAWRLRNFFVHGKGSRLAERVCQREGAKPFSELRDEADQWLKAWTPDTYAGAKEELLRASGSRKSLAKVLQDLDPCLEKEMLGRARVLFATLSTLARPQVREQATRYGERQVKWVIVDEAGQAVEAQMLPVLVWQPQRALLAGDTKQLTATTSQLGRDVGYGRSLMSRLEELGMVPHMLNLQYRMLPPISSFPARHFYGSKLHDSQVWKGTDPSAMLSGWLSKKCPMESQDVPVPAYAFLNLSGTERQAGASRANDQEAEFCVDLASSLLGGSQRVGEERTEGLERPNCIIITFYAGQKEALEQLTLKLPEVAQRPQVHTVDSFQGSEAEQVVISFVRSNLSGRTGFLSDYRRLNVALTRARRSLFLVGDLTFMKSTESDLAILAQDAESRGLVAEAEQVHWRIKPEKYAAPAVTLVPSSGAGQKPVTLTPSLTSQMSTSQKIDAPLSALI